MDQSAQFVRGVGPYRVRLLHRLGIRTVEDLLLWLPRRYEDRRHLTPIAEVRVGEVDTVRGTVVACGARRTRTGLPLFELAVGDGHGVLHAVWFNQPYLARYLTVGCHLILHGRVEWVARAQMNHPEYEVLEEGDRDPIHTERIVPMYPLTQDLTQRALRSIMKAAVERYARHVPDPLPGALRQRLQLVSLATALRTIHFPEDLTEAAAARRRLVFEEFFVFQLGLARRRAILRLRTDGIRHAVRGALLDRFLASLPFTLTEGQRAVLDEVARDLAAPRPMNRLLEGEVGSGKTVVAAAALAMAVQGGYQAVVMAPTEILAEQHHRVLEALFAPVGIGVHLLLSGQPAAQRRVTLRGARTGEAQIVVGTHALLEDQVRVHRLGLVVIDEQHKFGVQQRAGLQRKGWSADMLVMTATPIPRTLALTLYGDLDISTIRGLPPGRQPVETHWVRSAERPTAYARVREELARGHQAYVVAPVIEGSEPRDLRAVTRLFEMLQRELLPGVSLGLLHGRLRREEKDALMRRFTTGTVQVLVSTVLVEVGVDVPNATCMVIEHAERFGLAQLHQLRGRVGRGSAPSVCLLVADAGPGEAAERLQAVVRTHDGRRIAEEDLAIRGPGNVFGTAQHGLPDLRIGDVVADLPLMQLARREATAVVQEDQNLRAAAHRPLAEALQRRFGRAGLGWATIS